VPEVTNCCTAIAPEPNRFKSDRETNIMLIERDKFWGASEMARCERRRGCRRWSFALLLAMSTSLKCS